MATPSNVEGVFLLLSVSRSVTVLREPAWTYALLWVGFPLAGALVLGGVQAIAGWLSTLPFMPFSDLVKWLATLPQPLGMLGTAAVGALLGAGIGFLGYLDTLRVELDADMIQLKRVGREQPVRIKLTDVDSAFHVRRELVILDDGGDELAREKSDISAARFRQALTSRGLAWREGDPYAGQWRRWFDGMQGLPDGAHALLRTRQQALGDDELEDAAQIREELRNMGVMVRQEGKKQYCRVIGAS